MTSNSLAAPEPAPSSLAAPSLRRRVYLLLDEPTVQTSGARRLRIGLMVLIALNVVAVVLESVASLRSAYAGAFLGFELLSVAVFTGEYLARLWAIVESPRFAHPLWGRLRFAFTPLALIDLLAILPTFLPLALHLDLRWLRLLRLVRVFRVLKLARYSRAVQSLGRALTSKAEEIVVTLFALSLLLVLCSALMYGVEREAQPEAFSSIPAAMWWAVATLTTVGYGDVYPVTPLGRILGTVVAVLGVGLFAMPAAIWSGAFLEQMTQGPRVCQRCGEPLDSGEEPETQ